MTRTVSDDDEAHNKGHTRRVVDHVVEQRVSNLAQGLLTLGTMTGPLLVVLHLIPQAVLAGLFFVMGVQALEGNGITAKLAFLARDRAFTSSAADLPLKRVHARRPAAVWAFVGLELLGFGATFAITQTIAAVGFPVFILALIPVRTWVLPRYFSPQELGVLDAPTASPFTMESVGGIHGEDSESSSSGAEEEEGRVPAVAVNEDRGEGSASQIEESDEAERGEAAGYLKAGDAQHQHHHQQGGGSVRRASFRHNEDGKDGIELADVNKSR